MLFSFAPITPQPVSIPLVLATPEEQVYESHPMSHDPIFYATDPLNAYDDSLSTYAYFSYSAKSGLKTALELISLESPVLYPTKMFGTLPDISRVDFKMRYNASENPGGNDYYRIVYYVSATHVGAGDTTQNVTLVDWTLAGVAFPTTFTWADQPEPTDTVWDWYDVNKIRFAVETDRTGGGDAGCDFFEYEAWVMVYSPKPEFRVDPENTTAVSPGSSFTIDIKAVDILDLNAYEFTLSYNTAVLNATSYYSYSPFTKYWGAFIDDPAGLVGMSYSMSLGTTVGVSGDKAVARITFVVDTTAGSLLDLHTTSLSSAKGVAISHYVFDGYYNREAIPEFPLGMALELALIAVIAYVWWKRRSKTKISKHTGRSSPVY